MSSLCALLLLFLQTVRPFQYPGEPCTLESTNQPGICSTLEECPHIRNVLQETRTRYPQICGFIVNVLLVCCPSLAVAPGPTPTPSSGLDLSPIPPLPKTGQNGKAGDISKQKCEEYATLAKNIREMKIPDPNEETVFHTTVVGGVDADRGEFPHMVLVGYEPSSGPVLWKCGGSIISDQYILTAAHCLKSRELGDAKYVKLGVHSQKNDSGTQQIRIAERIKHPRYTVASHYDDIALFKLETKIQFNELMQPACLDIGDEEEYYSATASGWGKTDYAGQESDILQKVILDIFSTKDCDTHYQNIRKLKNGIDGTKQTCAGSSYDDKDTCQGDSGGPLQVKNYINEEMKWRIIGVTSFGRTCGVGNIPGVYTKVSTYIQWIEEIVWP